LGILAHVDAGKTSLTERLLFAAGVIDEIGSVDDGSTQTDALALERQRGITIKSAVVSFVIDDVTVNLIDTPGHPDSSPRWSGCSTCSMARSWSSPPSKACRRRPAC
jgi:ribosomal protection tetracycline resistance protein